MDQGSEVQSEYDEQIERLESETAEHIKKLTSEIVGKWKQELTESHTTIQRSKTVLEKTQSELEVARTELSELTSEKITLQKSIESLQERFNKEITDYKTKVKDLNTELKQCKLQLTLLKDDVKHREEKLERFCTETDNLTKDHESKLEELQEKLQQSEQREKDTKAELDRLRGGLQISEQQPKYTKAQLDSKQIEIERLTQLVEISEAHINSQTNERKTLDAEFARKDQEHEQALQQWQQEIEKKDQERINALQQWLQEKAGLESTVNACKVKAEQTEHLLTQSRNDVKEREEALKRLQNELKQSKQRENVMKADRDRKDQDHAQALQQWQEDIKKNDHEHAESLKHIFDQQAILQDKLQGSEKQVESIKAELDRKNDQIVKLTDDLEKEMDNVNRAAKEKTDAIIKAQTVNNSLHDEIIKLQEKEKVYKKSTYTEHEKQQKYIKHLEGEWKSLNTTYEENTKRLKKLEKEIKDLHSKNKNIKEEHKRAMEQLQNDCAKIESEKNGWSRAHNEMQRHAHKLQSDYANLKPEAERLINQHLNTIENQRSRLQSFEKQVHELDQERSTLVLRLRKIAGAKLTTNNANIADLSDENRPTKLAEKFSELYDNEWTDAFEEICNDTDEVDGVRFMLELLQRAFAICTEMSKGHIDSMKRSTTTIRYSSHCDEPKQINRNTGPEGDSNNASNETTVLEELKAVSTNTTAVSGETLNLQEPHHLSDSRTTASGDTTVSEEREQVTDTERMQTDENEMGGQKNQSIPYGTTEITTGDNENTLSDTEQREGINNLAKANVEVIVKAPPAVIVDDNKQGQGSSQVLITTENKFEDMHQSTTYGTEMKTGDSEKKTNDTGHGGMSPSDSNYTKQREETNDQEKASVEAHRKEPPGLTLDDNKQGQGSSQALTTTEIKSEYMRGPQTDVDSGESIPYHQPPKTPVQISIPDALTSEFLKQLLDMRKVIGLQMEELVVEKVTKAIATEFSLELDRKPLTCIYIRKCVLLCWSMGLKDPPVYMEIITPDEDTEFDTDKFKAYTKTGKRLHFVVWPPLYLHKDGPLLSKGVAQGARK